jgi:hypothetical protein
MSSGTLNSAILAINPFVKRLMGNTIKVKPTIKKVLLKFGRRLFMIKYAQNNSSF